MLKIVVALLLLVSSSLAAFTVTPIAGGSVNGTLPKPATSNDYYNLAYYQVAIPINSLDVAFTFENLDTAACSDLVVYMAHTLPCSPRDSGNNLFQVCRNGHAEDVGDTVTEVTYGPEGLSNLNWRVNTTLYLGVGRYYNSPNATCQFRINTTVTPCPNAEGGITQTGIYLPNPGINICYPFRPVIANFVIPAANIANNITFFGVVTVPPGAVAIKGVVNATTDALTLAGQNYGPPNFAVNNDICQTSTPTDAGNGTFTYILECIVPASGPFFFSLTHDPAAFALYNATLVLTFQTCAPGMGGFNCSAVATPLAVTDTAVPVVLPAGEWRYFYYDFSGVTDGSWTISAATNNTGTLWVRKGGYPYNDGDVSPLYENGISSGSNTTFYITPEDTFNGGMWYVGIQNDDTDPSSYTLYSSGTPVTAPTEAEDTTAEPTPTEDSNAMGLFPLTVVVALLAVFSSFF